MSDRELIQQYVNNRSEKAFSELVSRYAHLVYSSCLRQLRNVQLAEDTSQAVFMLLAEKADTLTEHSSIAGWLMNCTRFASLNALKYEKRRHEREKEAAEMAGTVHTEQPDWDGVAEYLDEALQSIDEKDREIVVLRYFQNRKHREVAAQTGLSEAAVQKRSSRALEKLRSVLEKKGTALPAGVLTALLVQNAVQAAPASLAALCTAAGTGSAAAGGSVYTIYKGALFMIVWTKTKIAALVAGVSILLGTAAGIVTDQHAEHEISQIRQELSEKKADIENREEEMKKLQSKIKILEQRNREVSHNIDSLIAQLDKTDQKLSERENELKTTLRVWAIQQAAADQNVAMLEKKKGSKKGSAMPSMIKMLLAPEMKDITIRQSRNRIRKQYSGFFSKHKIDSRIAELFIAQMADFQYESMSKFLPLTMSPSPENEKKAFSIQKEMNEEHERCLKEILGTNLYDAYNDYSDKIALERDEKQRKERIEEFDTYLSGKDRLSQKQKESLADLLKESAEWDPESGTPHFLKLVQNPEVIAEKYRRKEKINLRLSERAAAFLNETQMQKLKGFLRDETEQIRIFEKMTQKMFFPPEDKKEAAE